MISDRPAYILDPTTLLNVDGSKMAIRVHCESCDSELSVKESMAGQRGKCPRCGNILTVPLLGNVTPEEMAEEFGRRGQSAIIIVFDTPTNGNYELHTKSDVILKCFGTDDMTAEQMNTAIRSTATMSEWHETNQLTVEPKEPYEFKGDQLGMRLEDFKKKYHRTVDGHDLPAPFTSESKPGQEIDTLLAEPWHAKAGIVHCSIEFPFERLRGEVIPTVAGVAVDLLLYRFVDGHLYRISAYFDTRNFDRIQSAVIDKYGEPVKEDKKPVSLLWWNSSSSINLTRGRISPKEWSTLHFMHDELGKLVQQRVPDRGPDL